MLKLALFVISVAVLSQICEAGTLKRKRQAGFPFADYDEMVSDDYGFSGGGVPDTLTLYFYITYEKPFDDDLLTFGSTAFNAEAKIVVNLMKSQIARNIGLIPDDITVEVVSFSSGSTKAEIAVKIPGYYDISEDELSRAVTEVSFDNKIGKNKILKIEEIKLEATMEEMDEISIISLYLTYEYDSSGTDLSNPRSQAFADEEELIRQQVLLQLVEKLASQGVFVDDPDKLMIEIFSFTSEGPNTQVNLEIEASGVTMDELSKALSGLVEDDDVPADGRLIISVEELSRSVSYEYPDDALPMDHMDTEVMSDKDTDDFFNGDEPLPPEDDPDIFGEVMLPKKEINGGLGLNGDGDTDYGPDPVIPELVTPGAHINNEPTPPEDIEILPPEENERLPPEANESSPPEGTEPLPPEANELLPPEAKEQLPPDDNEPLLPGTDELVPPDSGESGSMPPEIEPTPPSPSCNELLAPENGNMDCMRGNDIGSTCHFTCDDDTRLEGARSIICRENGYWSDEAPFCVRIFCQPHILELQDGSVACTSQNVFQSVCTFSCGENYTLLGPSSVQCLKDSTWSTDIPFCEENRLICEDAYGPWSECADGKRVKAGTTAEFSTTTVVCPEIEEACQQDCEIAWSEWSKCGVDRKKNRGQVVVKERIGAGAACPPLEAMTEDCANCVLSWDDWGPCVGGTRKRTERIHQAPFNGGTPCEELQTESKACTECEVTWGDWGECKDGVRTRTQYISKKPVSVDDPCPPLQNNTEKCTDCVSYWGPWSECLNGLQVRDLIIESEPVGAGAACPLIIQDMKECCFFEQEEWSECEDGTRVRGHRLVVQPTGQDCPEPELETEDCQDCVVSWSEWGTVCTNNKVSRTEYVSQKQIGGGGACAELRTEEKVCANCEITWSEWGPCIDGSSEKRPEITVEPYGVGRPCPDLDAEFRECADCVVAWGDWSECSNGVRNISERIVVQPFGGGVECPKLTSRNEDCLDCIVEWEEWSECEDGVRIRSQYIKQEAAGVGKGCPTLKLEDQICVDCVVEWEEWSECADDVRSKKQFIAVEPQGAGKLCPDLETRMEACIDCVVEWGPWSDCFSDSRSRQQSIVVELVGAGRECPPLESETEECVVPGSKKALEKTICRFTDHVLGYKRKPVMRDLLLIGDDSGSIRWPNFDKIKENFKAIARNIRGGIGSQETQIAMTTFATFSRQIFDFDDHHDVDDLVAAVDKTYFRGGYRSRIGDALVDANAWVFQQSGGMRSFPNKDDNIEHEILIATDGCRTSDIARLKEGLKTLKKRGIKLYVLAVASKDIRCQKTVQAMVDDEENLFQLGGWDQMDEMNKRLEERVCVSGRRGDSADQDEFVLDP